MELNGSSVRVVGRECVTSPRGGVYPVYGMCSGMDRGMFGIGHAVRLLSGALTGTGACAGWRLIRSEERAGRY